MLAILLAVLSAWTGTAADKCPKVAFKGYKFQKSTNGEDHFYKSKGGVTLVATCLAPQSTFEQVVEKFKKESSVRNTNGDAVYFEFDVRGRYKRIYVVARKPVPQLTFSTKWRNRAALDDTQYLIEKQFKKLKNPPASN